MTRTYKRLHRFTSPPAVGKGFDSSTPLPVGRLSHDSVAILVSAKSPEWGLPWVALSVSGRRSHVWPFSLRRGWLRTTSIQWVNWLGRGLFFSCLPASRRSRVNVHYKCVCWSGGSKLHGYLEVCFSVSTYLWVSQICPCSLGSNTTELLLFLLNFSRFAWKDMLFTFHVPLGPFPEMFNAFLQFSWGAGPWSTSCCHSASQLPQLFFVPNFAHGYILKAHEWFIDSWWCRDGEEL